MKRLLLDIIGALLFLALLAGAESAITDSPGGEPGQGGDDGTVFGLVP